MRMVDESSSRQKMPGWIIGFEWSSSDDAMNNCYSVGIQLITCTMQLGAVHLEPWQLFHTTSAFTWNRDICVIPHLSSPGTVTIVSYTSSSPGTVTFCFNHICLHLEPWHLFHTTSVFTWMTFVSYHILWNRICSMNYLYFYICFIFLQMRFVSSTLSSPGNDSIPHLSSSRTVNLRLKSNMSSPGTVTNVPYHICLHLEPWHLFHTTSVFTWNRDICFYTTSVFTWNRDLFLYHICLHLEPWQLFQHTSVFTC